MHFITFILNVFHECNTTVLNHFHSITTIIIMVSKHFRSSMYWLSHPLKAWCIVKERIEGSPLLPILSTLPGDFQPSQVISKVSLPFLNHIFNQAVSIKRTHLFSYLYSGVYWPLTNQTGFHNCPFSEQPWFRPILTLRILQHALVATLCS